MYDEPIPTPAPEPIRGCWVRCTHEYDPADESIQVLTILFLIFLDLDAGRPPGEPLGEEAWSPRTGAVKALGLAGRE